MVKILRRFRSSGFVLAFATAILALPGVVRAGPPFETDDPEPVDEGHFEVNVAALGITGRGATGAIPGIDANYGPAPDLQLHLGVQAAYAEAPHGGWTAGYGDTELGVKYRFVEQDPKGWRPDIAFYPNIELPTGAASKGLGAGHVQLQLPLWIEEDWGPWSSYGGGGYWYSRGAGDQDFWFAGWLLSRKVTDELMLGGEVFRQTPTVIGARANNGFTLGGSYDVTEGGRILFSGGRGPLENNNGFGYVYYLGYQFEF